MSDNRALQQNSIIRALKLLEVLKSGTDNFSKLTTIPSNVIMGT